VEGELVLEVIGGGGGVEDVGVDLVAEFSREGEQRGLGGGGGWRMRGLRWVSRVHRSALGRFRWVGCWWLVGNEVVYIHR